MSVKPVWRMEVNGLNAESGSLRAGRKMALFGLLDGLYFFWFAAVCSYMGTYLLDRGLKASRFSLLSSVFLMACFAGSFVWGSLCDRMRTNRRVFMPELAGSVLIAVAIVAVAGKSLTLACVLYPVFGFFTMPLGSSLDSWMMREFQGDSGTYGIARGMGSVGYAVSMLITGSLISHFGYKVMVVSALCYGALLIGLAWKMPESGYRVQRVEGSENGAQGGKKSAQLLRIPAYLALLMVLFLSGLALSPVNNLKIVLIQNVGGDVSVYGLDSFIGVMVQAVMIWTTRYQKRIGANVRMLLMTVFIAIGIALMLAASAPAMIIAGSVCLNISFGLMLPAMREITESSVPDGLRTTAHSLGDACHGSVPGVMALIYSGLMMEALGVKSILVTSMAIITVTVGLQAVLTYRRKLASRKSEKLDSCKCAELS